MNDAEQTAGYHITQMNLKIRTNNIRMRFTLQAIMIDSHMAMKEMDKWDADSLANALAIIKKIHANAANFFDAAPIKPIAVTDGHTSMGTMRCGACARMWAETHIEKGLCPHCRREEHANA